MRTSPVARVRERLARSAGPTVAGKIPSGYQRLGRVLVVRLDESLRPVLGEIGEAYRAELGVETVLRKTGPVLGDWRVPWVERIAGTATETEVVEHGIRYRFDAAELLFSRGNRAERQRAGRMVRPGETVADLFAGIGYFTLPAARAGAERVYACEANPASFAYLLENARRNHLERRVIPILGDNRSAPIPPGTVDRVFLGLLPTSLPFIERALCLGRPSGAWLHVHLVVGAREGPAGAEARVREAVERLGAAVLEARAREVKPYGPGAVHAVVDVHARAGGPAALRA